MNKIKTKKLIIYFLFLVLFLSACQTAKPPETNEYTGYAFGGFIQYKLIGSLEDCQAAYDEIRLCFVDLEQEFSANIEDSQLAKINHQAGLQPVTVSRQMISLLKLSQEISKASDGAFNPVIGPLVHLWNIGFDSAGIPKEEDILSVLPLLNVENLELKEELSQVYLKQGGMALDLGAIVKGFAAEQALKICQQHQLQGALISVNGNLAVYGRRDNQTLWKIGITDPRGQGNQVVGSIALENRTVSTSGDYERYFEVDGVRYHHLLDSKTGYPAETDLISVSIFSADGALGDALSTAAFIMGSQQAKLFLAEYESIEYLLIDRDFSLWASPDIRLNFEISGPNYHWGKE